ncbi:hypothetical protein QYE76_051533 [Lolium multiflorum]|uniref:Uncharacterized protein n=1 Tax=Lolium multiflorum TaxID=4521 RepID=A0AAD8STA0_LOLMU|nr:hypothetical protein QYE76_051533 [Lolium multiflorum]
MASSGSDLGGEDSEERGVVNLYLNSVLPLKTLTFKEGVLLIEVKDPKTEGTMEEKLLDKMNIEMEKKVEAYEARIKDMEEKYVHTITQVDRFQALMWDMENQKCEYEDCRSCLHQVQRSTNVLLQWEALSLEAQGVGRLL